ncbi:prolactin-releasing peptide [Monodelphis domestica]|uniref:prolactin-releasing peptide n=1 Tax=Monodelphis domestica TaxID=13616 RepID=UPI0024E1D8F8|nr:prolactin-releasing peptide [Monodelphis domestica]
MKLRTMGLVYLLLTCLALPKAECRLPDRSMEIRNPDINPSWYTGRGIRPVGRFGRRREALEGSPKAASGRGPACFPAQESHKLAREA